MPLFTRCTLVTDVADGDEWLHEIKYDGWRLMARKHGESVRLVTRGGMQSSFADAHDLQGVVSKRVTSRYHPGQRTRDWLNVKYGRTDSTP